MAAVGWKSRAALGSGMVGRALDRVPMLPPSAPAPPPLPPLPLGDGAALAGVLDESLGEEDEDEDEEEEEEETLARAADAADPHVTRKAQQPLRRT